MNKINDSRQRNRLSKFLTLILRHRPSLIGMEIDSEGWTSISLDEVAKRISEKDGLEWVTADSLKTIVETDVKGRYQIKNNGLRATYGHSVKVDPLESPDDIEDLPEILFYGTHNNELKDLLLLGLIPGMRDRNFLHLSVRKNDALYVARHHSRFPRIIKINVPLAAASGVRFKQVSPLIVLTDEIPSQFLEAIPLPPHLKNRNRFNRRDDRNSRIIHQQKPSDDSSIDNQSKSKSSESSPSTVYFETDDDFD